MNFAKHIVAASLLSGVVFNANADVITDWNIKAGEIVTESKLGTPPAIRAMAIVQTAVHDAVNAVPPGASINAAVAAANRVTLTKLMPSAAGVDRRGVPGSAGADRRRPGKDRGHRRRRTGGNSGARAARRRRRRSSGGVSAAHHSRHVRADRDACGHAVAAAQALADGERGAVSAGPAAGADQRCLGARLQRGQVASAPRAARGAAPSKPRSRASGSTRCRRSITASCARSRWHPGATWRRTRACSRRSRRRWTTR